MLATPVSVAPDKFPQKLDLILKYLTPIEGALFPLEKGREEEKAPHVLIKPLQQIACA